MNADERIERCFAARVRALAPYPVDDATGLTKLDAMENPYPMPSALREAWLARLADVELNRYPDPHARALKARWKAALGLGPDVAVVLGNGSDELIHLLMLAVAGGRAPRVLAPEPSFAVYRIAAEALGLEYLGVPLSAGDFALDLPAMLAAIERTQPALVFLASPNNPTANRLDEGALDALCAAAPGLVVLDEAYYRFAGASRVGEVARHDNLVVLHTLSKIGLAGLRIGALFGRAGWLDPIERLRLPYNVGTLTQVGAAFALDHEDTFAAQIARITDSRRDLAAALAATPGIEVWPSVTNFLLFRVPTGAGDRTWGALRNAGILVKNVGHAHPQLADCLRVTVGTARENGRFHAALLAALA